MANAQIWDRLTIDGLRGLSGLRLDGLGSLNLLLGANDSGKTTILEGAFLLAGLGNPELPVRVQRLRRLPTNDVTDLYNLFRDVQIDRPLKVSARSTDLPEHIRELRVSIEAESADGNGSEGAGVDTSSAAADSRTMAVHATVWREKKKEHYPASIRLSDSKATFTKRTGPKVPNLVVPARYIDSNYRYDARHIGDIIVKKRKQPLLDVLRQLNPRVENIAVRGDLAYLDIGLSEMLPIDVFGRGVGRVAAIAASCMHGRNRILLIDELEDGLHYRSLPPLIRALLYLSARQRIQIFAATHSLEVLEALQAVLTEHDFRAQQEDVRCFALQKDRAGIPRAYRYEFFQFDHCIRNGIEIR